MTRSRTFFVREATECLETARKALNGPGLDRPTLYGAVRRFRGSAQMARYSRLARAARAMERRLRPEPEGEAWGDALAREVAAALEEWERGVAEVRTGRWDEDPDEEAGMEGTEAGGTDGGGAEGPVPIESLEYEGTGALERALSLRGPLERALVSDEPVDPILDELFDLIRLGGK